MIALNIVGTKKLLLPNLLSNPLLVIKNGTHTKNQGRAN